MRQSEDIGSACHALIEGLFAHRVLDNLRAAQRVIGLARNSAPSASKLPASAHSPSRTHVPHCEDHPGNRRRPQLIRRARFRPAL